MRSGRIQLATVLVWLLGSTTALAQSDSAAVVSVIEEFHHALATGDSAAAMSLLASDARVLEGGSVETREDYAAGHLEADMAFVRNLSREVVSRDVTIMADVAWVTSVTRTRGDYQGREIDSRGAELMILGHIGDEWLIRAIHWSSGR